MKEEKFTLLNFIYKKKMIVMDQALNADIFDKCEECMNKEINIDNDISNRFTDKKEINYNDYGDNLGFLISPKDFCKSKVGILLNNNILITNKEYESINYNTNQHMNFINDNEKILIEKEAKNLINVNKNSYKTMLDEKFTFFINEYFIYSIKLIKQVKLDQFVLYRVEKNLFKNIYPQIPEYSKQNKYSLICSYENLKEFGIIRYLFPEYKVEVLSFPIPKDNKKNTEFLSLASNNLIFNDKLQIIVSEVSDYKILNDFLNKEKDIKEKESNFFISSENDYMAIQQPLIVHTYNKSKYLRIVENTLINLNKKTIENSIPDCNCVENNYEIRFPNKSESILINEKLLNSFNNLDIKNKDKPKMVEIFNKTMYFRGFNNQIYNIDYDDSSDAENENTYKESIFDILEEPIKNCQAGWCENFTVSCLYDSNILDSCTPNLLRKHLFSRNTSNSISNNITTSDYIDFEIFNSNLNINDDDSNMKSLEILNEKLNYPLLVFSETVFLTFDKINNTYKQKYYLNLISSSNFINEVMLPCLNPPLLFFKSLLEALNQSVSIEKIDLSGNNFISLIEDKNNLSKYNDIITNINVKNIKDMNNFNDIDFLDTSTLNLNTGFINLFFQGLNYNLKELIFENCYLTDAIISPAFSAMAKGNFDIRLESLNFNNNFLTSESFDKIILAIEKNCFKTVKDLSFANNNLTNIKKIASLVYLERLNLFNNPIDNEEAEYIIKLIEKPISRLKNLNVGKTKISKKFVVWFSNALNTISRSILSSDNETYFEVSNKGNTSSNNDDINKVKKKYFKQDGRFEYINFSYCILDDHTTKLLSDYCFDKSKILHTLNLTGCEIKFTDETFGNNLKFNESLKNLILDNNYIDTDSFNYLLKSICYTKLHKLSLSNNIITSFNKQDLITFLTVSEKIQTLDISNNHLEYEDLRAMIIIIKFYSKKSQLIEVKLSDQKSLKRIDYFTLLARENFPGNYKITGNNYHLFCSDQQEFEKLDNLINEKKYQFELASAIFDEMIKRGSHCLDNLENDIYKENLTYLELSNKINQKIKVNFSEVKDGNILFYLYRHNILEYNQDESGKEELDRIYLVSQIKFMCKGCKNSYRKKINILIN